MTVCTKRRTRTLFAVLPALALVLTACGGSSSSGGGKAQGSIAQNFDFSGAHFTVGSKEFTENVILGKITVQALRAAGADVTDKTNLQGSTVVRDALLNDSIGMYWDYAGTGWSLYLKHDQPVQGAMAQFQATAKEDLAKNNVKWLGPAQFGDAYGIARRSNATGDLAKVKTYSDIATFVDAHPDQATFCGASEFFDRRFKQFEQTYNLKFPSSQVHTNALALDYTNVAKGDPCNFAEIFTTDARIQTQNLTVLKDDKGVFFTQLAALCTKQGTYQANPKLGELAKTLGDKLTTDTMISLNKQVDVEGKSADDAAKSFLSDNGFVTS